MSSIELLVVDQMDALTMQNWDHVKFVMSHMNKLPKESHDTDFSRIKPWYLDGQYVSPLLKIFVISDNCPAHNTSANPSSCRLSRPPKCALCTTPPSKTSPVKSEWTNAGRQSPFRTASSPHSRTLTAVVHRTRPKSGSTTSPRRPCPRCSNLQCRVRIR